MDHIMKARTIISRAESLQILRNDLRKAALEKRAGELKDATVEKRATILAEIDRDIEKKTRRRAWTSSFGDMTY
jgi:hypothetical protein